MKKSLLVLTIWISATGFFQPAAFAEESKNQESKKIRPYPGGRDESDLEVQEKLPTPTTTVDRRSIQQRVLNSYFKKDVQLAPEEADSE